MAVCVRIRIKSTQRNGVRDRLLHTRPHTSLAIRNYHPESPCAAVLVAVPAHATVQLTSCVRVRHCNLESRTRAIMVAIVVVGVYGLVYTLRLLEPVTGSRALCCCWEWVKPLTSEWAHFTRIRLVIWVSIYNRTRPGPNQNDCQRWRVSQVNSQPAKHRGETQAKHLRWRFAFAFGCIERNSLLLCWMRSTHDSKLQSPHLHDWKVDCNTLRKSYATVDQLGTWANPIRSRAVNRQA